MEASAPTFLKKQLMFGYVSYFYLTYAHGYTKYRSSGAYTASGPQVRNGLVRKWVDHLSKRQPSRFMRATAELLITS
jgi:hypothetical protein